MCAITGEVDYNKDLKTLSEAAKIRKMSDSMYRRGPDASGERLYTHAALAHKRLTVRDKAGGGQPMTAEYGGESYTLVYNGELYNAEEIKKELISGGFVFSGTSDTEVLLKAFIKWDVKALDRLNGIFAFGVWKHNAQTLTLVRDRLGVKPLFYALKEGGILFASELKALLVSGEVKPVIEREGLLELLLMFPSRTPGAGIIKGVNELKPAHYLVLSQKGAEIKRYWSLKAEKFVGGYAEAVLGTRHLVTDAVTRQLVSDVPLATFLSGGLDSSIISSVAAKKAAEEGRLLDTFSVDYEDNDKNFVSNAFQPAGDGEFIKIMSNFIGSRHHSVILDNAEVFSALKDAADARDLPGMADIDSSLLLFCKEVKRNFTVALSGECADEIFGGYPWYHKEEYLFEDGFPWSRSLALRKKITADKKISGYAEEYVKNKYKETAEDTDFLDGEDKTDRRRRIMFRLNTDWFMQCLLERKDRMSMYSGLEVRVPYCDHRLVEYAYNMPWEFKSAGNREKAVLREAFKGILPDSVVYRKKNPYPKTFSPIYTGLVRQRLSRIIEEKGLISEIYDTAALKELLDAGGAIEPFYGQLMRLPQLFGFIIEADDFFKKYGVNLK